MHDEDGSATLAPGSAGDGGLTVTQTAQQLGISTDAVRRRLKAGELVGHQRQAKHGPAWCVHPDEPPGSRNGDATVAQGSAPIADDANQAGPSPGLALMQAEAMAAYTRSVLESLVSALERSEGRVAELERENGRLAAEAERARASEQVVERQAGQLAKKLETIGELRAENRALPASTAPEPPEPSPEPPSARLRTWAP
jgi:hypothetical protein